MGLPFSRDSYVGLVPYGVMKLRACKVLEVGTIFCQCYCLHSSCPSFIASYYCMFFYKVPKASPSRPGVDNNLYSGAEWVI